MIRSMLKEKLCQTAYEYTELLKGLDMETKTLRTGQQGKELYGYSEGLKTGDRVILFGTVTDVSETGVEEIRVDTDPEGFVIVKKLIPEPHVDMEKRRARR